MNPRKIVSAQAYDGDPNEIHVELDNGAILMLRLTHKLHDPLFAKIQTLHLPRTDGGRIYWPGGAAITLEEILGMLLSSGDAPRNQNNHEEE